MKKIKYFTLTMLATSIFWYLVVSFVKWNIGWDSEIPSYDPPSRFGIFLLVVLKVYIDCGVWIFGVDPLLKEDGLIK